MADDERPPFGHPDFYAPISHMLRDAAKDADCHAYTEELLFAADEIERLREREQDLRMHAEQDACEIERLRAEHDAIDTLHHPVSSGKDDEVCNNCGCFWPCTTHSLLHPKEARRG